MKSLLLAGLVSAALLGVSLADSDKAKLCSALARAEKCLAAPKLECVQTDVCDALEQWLGRSGRFACFIFRKLSDHSQLDKVVPLLSKALSKLSSRFCKPSMDLESPLVATDVCDKVENAMCTLESGNVEGAVKEICLIVAQYVPAAKQWCSALPTDLGKLEKAALFFLNILASAKGCQPHPCTLKAALVMAESKKELCDGCHKADCLFRSGDVQEAETELCKIVEQFVPKAEPICRQILKETGMSISLAEYLVKAVENGAGCPPAPACPKKAVEVIDEIDEKTCGIIDNVFCLFESHDFENAEKAICDAVEQVDPKIRALVAKYCKDVEIGTDGAARALASVLRTVMLIGHCSMPPCPKPPAAVNSFPGQLLSLGESVCKGAMGPFCCQACQEVVGVAEKIVLASDTKELAEEKLKDLCASQYEDKPLQKLVCDGMVVAAIDQAWNYIHEKEDPHQACVQMKACPSSLLL